jgi:hypothetical protein
VFEAVAEPKSPGIFIKAANLLLAVVRNGVPGKTRNENSCVPFEKTSPSSRVYIAFTLDLTQYKCDAIARP